MRNAIAIDLGGTHASVGILQERELLASRDVSLEATAGLRPLLQQLRETTLSLLGELSLSPAQCIGVALSLPSLVDFRAGRIASVNNKFPDAQEIDLQAWSQESFRLPLVLENDARAALLGEVTASAITERDIVMITLGTGVGCAVLAGGVPFRTMQPQGGNLGGHIPVRLDGRRCSCGAYGCMESEASGWALPLGAQEIPGFLNSSLADEPQLDFATVFAHFDAGDAVAAQLIHHCVHVWSVGTVGLVHAYGPQLVIFGGGVMARASDVLPPIQEYLKNHAWTPAGTAKVAAAKLGNRAPLYAAIRLVEEFQRVERR